MPKYINADEYAKKLDLDWENYFRLQKSTEGLDTALSILDEMPSADVVEVKHGEWKSGKELGYEQIGENKFPFYGNFKCSECGKIIDTQYKPNLNFCPNCGADMRGETK